MNDYRISYTADSEESSVCITERSETAARKVFKAGYKGMDITAVEMIREGVSATKPQEREALEAIRQIIAELGPRSYVGTALEGCLEDADQNIEYDAAFSMKGRLELAERETADLRQKLKLMQQTIDRLQQERDSLEAQRDDLLAAQNRSAETSSRAGEAQRRAENAEAEVILLKAKLYDYMTAGA